MVEDPSWTGPLTLRNIFDLQDQFRKNDSTPLTILDLTGVPYMDSAGMGVVVNGHVHCQSRGVDILPGINAEDS